MRCMLLAAATCTALLTSTAFGQGTLDRPVGEDRAYPLDSGAVGHVKMSPAVVFHQTVHVEDAAWLRLFFDRVVLSPGRYQRVTSTLDGQTQKLDAESLAMWRNTTAYFNGDTVTVELIASPGRGVNRVVIDHVAMEAGQGMPWITGGV